MNKKIVIATGGTGGHIFPAMALATELSKRSPSTEIRFAGGALGSNPYFKDSSYAFKEVKTSTISLKKPLSWFKGGMLILKGTWQAVQFYQDFQPDLVVGYGSFYTIPLLNAAVLRKIPFVLYHADSIPGKVNRWYSRFAKVSGAYFSTASSYLKGPCEEVGMPLREGFCLNASNRQEAIDYFGLDPKKKTLLVFGGSQGAIAINETLRDLEIDAKTIQIIHLTGKNEVTDIIKRGYIQKGIQAVVKPFELRMDLAWRGADFFLGRAGASTIAEAIEFEVPGILVPYPFSADGHQEKNAQYFAEKIGGGVALRQKDLNAASLGRLFEELSEDQMLIKKKRALASRKENRKKDFCQLVLEALDSSTSKT